MSTKKKIVLPVLLTGLIGLAACSSGDGTGDGSQPTPIPQSSNSYSITSANRLIGFDLVTPGTVNSSVSLTGLAAGESVLGVAFRPSDGNLYALITRAGAARVATVDLASGAIAAGAVLISDPSNAAPFTALNGARFGVDFNPVPDRLRVVTDAGQDLRINVDTGATIVDGALNGAAASATAAAYTNALATACRTSLYVIDPVSDRLYLQNPPNNGTLTSIGALGVDASAVGGFEITTNGGGTNTAFAALTTSSGSPAVVATALYTIDLGTGAATRTQPFALNSGESLIGIATRTLPASTVLAQAPGELVGLTTANRLATFMRGSPAKLCSNPAVSGLAAGASLLGITTRPSTGTLLGLGSDASLYSLTSAGAATALCTLAADPADATAPFTALDVAATTTYGIGFNPVPDRLRVVSNTGTNLRINTTPNGTGQCLVTTDTNISGSGTPSVTAVGYTNTVPGAGTTTLFGLDTDSDSLIRVGNDPGNGIAGDPGNPNSGVVTSIGSLGVTGDVAANAGFLIDGRLNTAIAALQVGTATTSTLYTVNLATGAATPAGVVGGGAPLRGLALTGGTTIRVYGLTFDGSLVSFGQTANAFTPNTLTELTITGVPSGETLVGLDFRPANGGLYALSTVGRLYTISTTTGLAILASTLAADPADITAPFSALTAGATYGVDFNPVADRLRVVDSNGNDLRINVMTGATTTDGDLTGNTGPIWAAGYTNSFAGTTATTLYDLDATTLYTQNPPNNGTLVAIGPLGVTAVNDIGFDIAGGANGLVLAAIRTTAGIGPSDLYRVNLATGAATPISAIAGAATIGTSSTSQIRSLAVDIR